MSATISPTPQSKCTYGRRGETRIVTGVRRRGQGKGAGARDGAVWWRSWSGGRERRCTYDEFVAWMDRP